MLLELLAMLAATCAVLYYRFRRKCTYWYAIIVNIKYPWQSSTNTYVMV